MEKTTPVVFSPDQRVPACPFRPPWLQRKAALLDSKAALLEASCGRHSWLEMSIKLSRHHRKPLSSPNAHWTTNGLEKFSNDFENDPGDHISSTCMEGADIFAGERLLATRRVPKLRVNNDTVTVDEGADRESAPSSGSVCFLRAKREQPSEARHLTGCEKVTMR